MDDKMIAEMVAAMSKEDPENIERIRRKALEDPKRREDAEFVRFVNALCDAALHKNSKQKAA